MVLDEAKMSVLGDQSQHYFHQCSAGQGKVELFIIGAAGR